MKKIIVSLFTVLLAATALTAQMDQVPDLMHYQTVIRNASGELLAEKEISVKITILEKESPNAEATNIYEETHTVTTDANGLAIIKIGSGIVTPGQISETLGEVQWHAGHDKWLRVEIDPTGGTNYSLISGESQLLTVPYASHSNTVAKAVGDLPLTDVIVLINDNSQKQDAITVEMIGKTFTQANAIATQTPMKLLAYTPTYISIKNKNCIIGNDVYISVSLNGVDINSEALNYNSMVQETTVGQVKWYQISDIPDESKFYSISNGQSETRYTPIDIQYSTKKLDNYSYDKESLFLIGPFLPNPTGGKNIITIDVNQIIN